MGTQPPKPNHPQNPDRKSGLLSKSDRNWLLNDQKDQYEKQRRYRIRERVKNGFRDLQLLTECWDQEEQDTVLDDPASSRALAFFFDLSIAKFLTENDEKSTSSTQWDGDIQNRLTESALEAIETKIEHALAYSIERRNIPRRYEIEVDVSINPEEQPSPEQICAQIERGELSLEELANQHRHGLVSTETFLQVTSLQS